MKCVGKKLHVRLITSCNELLGYHYTEGGPRKNTHRTELSLSLSGQINWRLLQSNQAHMWPHSSTKAGGAVATSHQAQELVPAQPTCRCDISLSACPGLLVQHTVLTFHQDFGDFCVAGTEGTVQLEPVSVVKKGSTQGKQHFLGFKTKPNQTNTLEQKSTWKPVSYFPFCQVNRSHPLSFWMTGHCICTVFSHHLARKRPRLGVWIQAMWLTSLAKFHLGWSGHHWL